MAEAAEKISFQLEVKGADVTRRAFEQTSTSMKKVDDQFVGLASSASKTASTFAALGGAAGKLAPGLESMGQAVGRASGAIQNMTAVLGGGIPGIVVGGAIALLGVFAERLAKAKEESAKLAEEQRKLAEATAKAAEEQLKAERALEAAATKRAVDFGKPSEVVGLESELSQAREDRSLFGKKVALSGGGFLDVGREQADLLDKKIADLERRLEVARAKPAEDAAKNELEALGKRADMYKDYANLQEKREAEAAEKRKKADHDELESELNLSRFAVSELSKNDDELAKTRALRAQQQKESQARSDREFALAEGRVNKQRLEGQRELGRAGIDAMESFAAGGIGALQSLAKGQKVSTALILAGIGDQMVSLGTMTVFKGLGRAIESYGVDPSAYALMGLGAAEIAAGVGIGAAVRGATPSASAGGGGPSKVYLTQNSDGTYRQSAIEPTANPSASAGGSQIVNVSMPTVIAPTSQDWKRVEAARSEARRQGV